MTEREVKLVKVLLDELHNEDGRQMTELLLHAGVNLRAKCSLAEFSGALALADTRGWVTGVASKYHGTKYSINDAGEAARLEL